MTISKLCFSLITFTIYNIAGAQWNEDILNNHSAGKYMVGISADGDFSSSAITNSFAYNWLTGNYLSGGQKQQVTSLLEPQNLMGYALNYGIYMVLYNDTSKSKKAFNFFISLRHKSYLNASFTPDDFEVPFYGNAGYAGRTAQLSPFHFENISYQQLEAGLVCTNFGRGAQFGFGVSVLAGQQFMAMNLPSATLYTAPTGESITFNSNAQLLQSDTAAGSQNAINGIGGSLDFYLRAPYKIGEKAGTIALSVSDLGFIWWNNKSLQYRKDTSYTFNGVTINNLNQLQNLSFHTLSKDSLQSKYLPYSKGGFLSTIPSMFNIKSVTDLSPKFHLILGFCNLFNANSDSYGYVQGEFLLSDTWTTALEAGYGGYAGLNFAAYLTKQFARSKLSIIINRLQGLALPGQFGGAGIYTSYSYIFDKWK